MYPAKPGFLYIFNRLLRKGSTGAKELAYEALVCPMMEYGVCCWDLYRKTEVESLRESAAEGS